VRHTLFQTLTPGGRFDRHRHAHAYAALVLTGGYVEAGDRGRFHARPGQVLIHGAWESHMDAVSGQGATVLNLPYAGEAGFGVGSVADPDAVARAAERDLVEASGLLIERLAAVEAGAGDWPDRLAAALRNDPATVLEFWAESEGLSPETVSRGFRQAFGISPRRYRAEQRALAAVRALTHRDLPPAALAAELGFADQAHMSRAVAAVTGLPPGRLRIKSVQSGARSFRQGGGMDRRTLLSAALAAPFAGAFAATTSPARAQTPNRPPNRTDWRVEGSEGQDAIAFLGPLSGRELYTRYYAADVEAFGRRLPDAVRSAVPALWAAAETDGVGLLSPNLALILSHADSDATLDDVIAALGDPEARIGPAFRAGTYWNESDWGWFAARAPDLRRVLEAMRTAGFAAFRQERGGAALESGLLRLRSSLPSFDIIRVEEKLTGRTFDPRIDITLLQFSKPHGIKVRGQRFLQAADYDVANTVRIAAHELLHPPVPMEGPAALAALEVLGRDPLIPRIATEHDPRWGYTTLDGLLNEDLCQALDQMVSEELGVARNPADRWRRSDDGIHVLAAGLYGLLRQDRWGREGGSIEAWLLAAARGGRLAPEVLHPVAARVLERPVDRLWPLAADA
jgi:AraC-like DNA-binding protein